MDNLSDKNTRITMILILSGVILLILGVFLYSRYRNRKDIEKYNEEESKRLKYLLEKKGWLKPNTQNVLKMGALGDTTSIPLGPKIPKPPAPRKPTKDQCPETVCPGLGKGFDLSKLNLNNPNEFLGGSNIFLTVNSENGCQNFRTGGKNTKEIILTKNTEELISNISNDNNIQGSIPIKIISVKPTITYSTKYDSTKHNNITTARLVLTDETGTITFKNDDKCRRANVNEEFVRDFKKLPVKILKPEISNEWQPFYAFINKWGSHVMTQITFGSKLEHWESYLSTDDMNHKILEAKACLEIEGPLPSLTSITASVCSKYSSEDRKKASELKTNKNTVVIGGTKDARQQIILDGTSTENIDKFLKSSKSSNQAIGYHFTPIWEIYQQVAISSGCISDIDLDKPISEDCKDLQRCLNLEAAYAYEAVDCKLLKTTNDIIYQKFEKDDSIPYINTYKCKVSKEGCTSTETDCHLGLGGCKAYGPSAFEKGAEYDFSGLYRTKVRGSAADASNVGINNSCKFSGVGGCSCDKLWSGGLSERMLWDQGNRI